MVRTCLPTTSLTVTVHDRTAWLLTMTVQEPLFNHGLEWFKILSRTRKAKPGEREKLLAECEALDRFHGIPARQHQELDQSFRLAPKEPRSPVSRNVLEGWEHAARHVTNVGLGIDGSRCTTPEPGNHDDTSRVRATLSGALAPPRPRAEAAKTPGVMP